MRINNEDNDEFLEVTEAQFNELIKLVAVSVHGYWLLSEIEWTILAIGLDQEPGGWEYELELEAKLQ